MFDNEIGTHLESAFCCAAALLKSFTAEVFVHEQSRLSSSFRLWRHL